MVRVVKHDKESFDQLLERFKRNVARAGILKEVRKRQYYLKPGVKKRQQIKENQTKKKSGR